SVAAIAAREPNKTGIGTAVAANAISTVAAIATSAASSSEAAISSESISTVAAPYRAVVYDTNKVHLMVRPERNSGTAIATKRKAAISVAAVTAVAAIAAVTASSVPAIAGRSFSNVAAVATIAFSAGAAVATIAAKYSAPATATKRRPPVTARSASIIDHPLLAPLLEAEVNDVVTSTNQNSVAAIATKRVAAISRPTVAAVTAVTSVTSSCVATSAARRSEERRVGNAAGRGC